MKTEDLKRLVLPGFVFLAIGILIGMVLSAASNASSVTGNIPSKTSSVSGKCAAGCFETLQSRNQATLTDYKQKTESAPNSNFISWQDCKAGFGETCFISSVYPGSNQLNCACWKTSP